LELVGDFRKRTTLDLLKRTDHSKNWCFGDKPRSN